MADDSDLPVEGTAQPSPKSEDELIGDISELLGDPDEDLAPEDEDTAKADDVSDESDEDDDEAEPEAVDDEADDEADDEPQGDLKGGRFAPDTAKVTLQDGTVTTVAELKRGSLFQRDYTKKTTELAEERKSLEATRSEVDQYAQQLNQSREYLAWFAEQHMPKQPEPFTGNPMSDPAGYLDHQHKMEQWRSMAEAYQTFQQQREYEAQRVNGETQQQAQQRLKSEADALTEAFPVLKNPEKRRGFWERLETGADKYFGISADEVRSVADHRMVKALHAAVKQMRLAETAPQVREEVAKRPAKSGRRLNNNAQDARKRQAQSERLRKDGSLESGISVLESFDL